MVKIRQRIYAAIAIVFMLFVTVLTGGIVTTAYAEEPVENVYRFDSTDVLDDLRSSTDANGNAFDISDYPYDLTGEFRHPEILCVVEYGYSLRGREDYALYLYLYNPQRLDIEERSYDNEVTMAVSWRKEGNETVADDFDDFDLQFLSYSTESDYYKLFYKFRVVDHAVGGKTMYERVNGNSRRYDIAGVDLVVNGADKAVSYAVGGSYIFTGFAKGCGPNANAESTLTCSVTELEKVELDVHNTFYRSKSSNDGDGYQNQLNSVYFSVPNIFFEKYGELQRIKAEWYEYVTKDIIVTADEGLYNFVHEFLGKEMPFGSVTYADPDKGLKTYTLLDDFRKEGDSLVCSWMWNGPWAYGRFDDATGSPGTIARADSYEYADMLYYLFLCDEDTIADYDPLADVETIGGIKGNVLLNYILNYDKTYENGTLPIKDGTISADLFRDDINAERKLDNERGKIDKGYCYYDFDASLDLLELNNWNGSHSFAETWKKWGLWNALFGKLPEEQDTAMSPIYIVTDDDLSESHTEEEISKALYVNIGDVQELRETAAKAKENDETVVLFRFAVTDYYSSYLSYRGYNISDLGHDWTACADWGNVVKKAYRAWETVFFGFDVIQLTFSREGLYRVIPAVASPLDIVGDITTPLDYGCNNLNFRTILIIIAVLVGVILLYPFLPYLVAFIVNILMLPVKAIKAIARSVNNNKK